MTRLDDARAKRRPRLAVVAFIASMFVLLITALIKYASVPDDIPARLAAARLPELVPPSSLLYLRVFMLAINLWAILLKLQMIEDKVIFHSPESQLPRRVEIRLSGFMWCSFFTFQAWALQTFYLAGALASSISAVYGTPALGARLPVALWFAFEVSFAVAVLTSFIVKYVLIPQKVQNGASVAGFFHLPDLLMHNCNTLFMALELLFTDLPVLLSHFPLAALCDFSSKGRPVGGSTGGGVASRRKSINTPPSNAEKRVVRAYAERVAEACGVELPPEEEGVAGASYGGAASSVVEEGEGEGEGDEGEEGDEEGEEEEEGEEGEESEEGEEEGEEDEEDEGEDEDDDDMLQRMVAGQRRPAKVEGRAEHDSDAADAVVSTASARVATATRVSASSAPAAPTAVEASSAAGHVTIGFVGHPNVGKTSLLNAFVGRKVASVSRTPGHTKHLQTWSLSPTVTVCDSPGLVFPVAGALVRGVNVGARAVYEACGLFPIAQIRETYSAVRLLHASQDLIAAYGLQHSPDLRDEPAESLSPHLFCTALAERKGYRIARGKGALDLHRAGLEVLKDCVDGALCLAFDPPPPSELGVAAAATPAPAAAGVDEKGEEALREVLEELRVWADAQRSRGA